ncbi:hypothetical protein ES708_04231 [subsurface metagenome]
MEEGKAKPRIALLSNKIFVEERCVMCDEAFETGEILPELYDEDGHLIGYVCDDCAYQPQSYASKLREQAELSENLAEALQNSAARLRQLADTGIQPPDADYRLKKGETATEQEIIDFCRTRLAGFKRPTSVVSVEEELPKTATGKVLRRILRDKYGKP